MDVPVAIRTVPHLPDPGSALDVFVEELSFCALRMVGADPASVPTAAHLAEAVRAFARVLEMCWMPGRSLAVVDLAHWPNDSAETPGLEVSMLLGVGGSQGGTRRDAAAFAGAALRILRRYPDPYRVASLDPGPLLDVDGRHTAQVRQGNVTVAGERGHATVLARFDRGVDSWLELVEALKSRPVPTRLRSTLLATEPVIDDHNGLRRELAIVQAIVDERSDDEVEHRARRAKATLLDLMESLRTPLFIGEVAVVSAAPLEDLFLREVAGAITREVDVAIGGAVPAVPGRTRLMGGYSIERDPPRLLEAMSSGLPLRGGLVQRDTVDLMSLAEAACIFQWPVPAGRTVPGVPPALPVAIAAPQRGLATGAPIGWDGEGRLLSLDEGTRASHLHLIGATGTGKTTTICMMARADLLAGRGFLLIDAHGDLVAAVQEVAWELGINPLVVDPTDPDTAAISLLIDPGSTHPRREELVSRSVSAVVEALTSHLPQEWAGPRLHAMLRAALTFVVYARSAQPFEAASEILSNPSAYHAAVPRWQGPAWVRRQLDLLHRMREHADTAHWAASKFDDFSMSVASRRVLAPTGKGIDLAAAMAHGRPVLVNLAKGQVSALETRLLGHVVLASAIDAGLARPPETRRLYTLYIDEAQSFPPQTLEVALAEGRKFAVGVVASHQSLAQLTPATRDALLGNAGTRVVFRIGAADAAVLGPEMGLSEASLTDLPNLHAAVRLTLPGQPPVVFSLRTPVPGEWPEASADDVIDLDRRKHPAAR